MVNLTKNKTPIQIVLMKSIVLDLSRLADELHQSGEPMIAIRVKAIISEIETTARNANVR